LLGLTAASLGVVYGYDLSNIAGALLFITDEFGLTTRQQELVTTAVVLGEIVGALGAGVLANLIGRKWSMVPMAAGYAVFALLGAMSDSVSMLLVARLLLGLTIGVSVVVVPVFVAESAPAAVRGSLLVGYQVATVFGIIPGYLACYLLADSRDRRWMLAPAALPQRWWRCCCCGCPTPRGGTCSRAGSPRPGGRCNGWNRTARTAT
jgi:MFS family permease